MNLKKILFIILCIGALFVSPAISLAIGIAYALILGDLFKAFSAKVSKYLLQASVVGLGFGMNINEALQSSSTGMLFTVFSVVTVLGVGYFLGRLFHIDKKLSYLISAGTAICGGSAIAAVAPVIKADSNQTSMSLAVIFTLNAIAMFLFPAIGHWIGLSQTEFGTWAAIGIHDTSSVVGAGQIYGEQALKVATTVKLTRALWIIPVSIFSMFAFNTQKDGIKNMSIPWFIFMFIVAMLINTYFPLPAGLGNVISITAHSALSLTLFLIGSMLSIEAVKAVGYKPIIHGIVLWFIIGSSALLAVTVFV
ncbi:MAG: putative sulfate exporter family transporter [Bacteroidales bacterium]